MAFTPFKPPAPPLKPLPNPDRPRVLYVEDEDINWEIVQHELENRYAVTRATNAREAFHLLSTNKYHLILMDIQLARSDLDGIAVTQILKGLYRGQIPPYAKGVQALETPIVFVTAYTARYRRDDLIDAGGEDLVAKPIDLIQLSLILARVWARGIMHRNVRKEAE